MTRWSIGCSPILKMSPQTKQIHYTVEPRCWMMNYSQQVRATGSHINLYFNCRLQPQSPLVHWDRDSSEIEKWFKLQNLKLNCEAQIKYHIIMQKRTTNLVQGYLGMIYKNCYFHGRLWIEIFHLCC